MRSILLTLCGAFLMLSGGCTANFNGQWLEEPVPGPNGQTLSSTGERRIALEFDPISGMRWGRYDEKIGLVDCTTVRSSSYAVFDGWNTAQFGSMNAKVEGDHMTANILGGVERHFVRLPGKDIFPPMVQLPSLTEQ
jgi:hypothetical protein